MTRTIDADALPSLLRPGMHVYVQGATAEPRALLDALARAPEASDGVHYVGCFLPGINHTDLAGLHPRARFTGIFVHRDIEASHAAGRVRFMPLHYSGFYAYLANHEPVDAALVQVGPPDAQGMCSFGPCVDFASAVLDRARLVIAELNHATPAVRGAPRIAFERLTHVLESERPWPGFDTGPLDASVRAVADHAAGLVGDRDVLQIGIGKLPAAILGRLGDRRDLGLHGGMITDEVAALVDAGALTGAAKTLDTGTIVCGVALGSERLYDWCAGRRDLSFRSANYTHDVSVIARLDGFVSINSALEIDLFGQANAEVIGGRQVSGTGGLMDYVRGARMARNGRSIIALGSTARGGSVSRIRAQLDAGAVVSCPRADVDCVVTEHGVARLRDRSLDERAEALIAVAAPAFRDELSARWEALRSQGSGRSG